jgi:hypothetical protein
MNKYPSIEAAVATLRERLGADTFELVNYWDADLCAIGVANPKDNRILVYVCSYGLPEGRYNVSLELPPENEEPLYKSAGEFESVSIDELVEITKKHLL